MRQQISHLVQSGDTALALSYGEIAPRVAIFAELGSALVIRRA
jgi:hypothetical protein